MARRLLDYDAIARDTVTFLGRGPQTAWQLRREARLSWASWRRLATALRVAGAYEVPASAGKPARWYASLDDAVERYVRECGSVALATVRAWARAPELDFLAVWSGLVARGVLGVDTRPRRPMLRVIGGNNAIG